jgi:hypothetical protein
VEALPNGVSEFIESFGTHMMIGIEMGGRLGYRSEFDSEAWSSFASESLDVSASIEYAGLWDAGIETHDSVKKKEAETFRSKRKTFHSFNVGGKFSLDTASWQATVRDDPSPIKYTLKPLDEVLTTAYLPDHSEAFLAPRREALRTALRNRCLTLKGEGRVRDCNKPGDDPVMELRQWGPGPRSDGQWACPHLSFITEVHWEWVRPEGLWGLSFECSDGTYVGIADRKDGRERHWYPHMHCPRGWHTTDAVMMMDYKPGRMINWGGRCLGDVNEHWVHDRWNWDTIRRPQTCPEAMPVVAGMATTTNTHMGGWSNVSYLCSNSNTATFSASNFAAEHAVVV